MKLREPIAILGFGTEGEYALEFLKSRHVSDITVCDHNKKIALPEGIKSRLGDTAFDDLSHFQIIVRSPGVRLTERGIQDAIELGRTVTSMTQLTLEEANDRMTVITGTNGKTTTTALTEAILRAHYGSKLIVGGNDRAPVLNEVMARPKHPVLMEASSFQYADVTHSPYIAAILNITPNHLDWHADVEEYTLAKSNILRHQKTVIGRF
ncbi:hypothetical protein IPJ72_07215 [Candidatus Peregrinibacteria bacterium]|nr:MAG: hypothetical protein IPJ72_07215 [Candidatus Peregrinibacteria bacterium]